MQRLEVSCVLRCIYTSLDAKGLTAATHLAGSEFLQVSVVVVAVVSSKHHAAESFWSCQHVLS